MKDLKKLRADRAAKIARGKAATTEYNALQAKADRTAEDDARLVALDGELNTLETEVEALDTEISAEEMSIRRAGLFLTPAAARPALTGARTYGEPGPGQGGYRSLAEFAVSVRNAITGGARDPRLDAILGGPAAGLGAAPANYEQNQGSAGEGFLVPVDFRTTIWELAFAPTDLLGMVTQIPTSSNMISMAKDETTPWGSTGVRAHWRSEGSQMTADKIAVGQITLQLHELYAFAIATSEILDDAPRLNDMLTNQAARAIRWTASEAIINGDGNGKPLGFAKANSLIVQNKEAGQATLTLAVGNILKMSSRLLRYGGGQAVWLANSDAEPQLASLTLGNIPFLLPNSVPGSSPIYEGTVRGKPLMFTEHCASLTNQGDIFLADLTGYMLATKAGGGVDFAASIHLFFDYNMQAFRWTFRMGGQPYLSAAVNPANGSNTKSHFVTLQAR